MQQFACPKDERRELISFLLACQTAADDEYRQFLADKIDSHDSNRWADLDELSNRFAE